MRLTLVLPELLWPEPGDQLALEKLPCPNLEWLLAHGAMSRRPALPYETALAAVFGLGAEAAFGPLRLLGERADARQADPREGHWLCADPVHLRFHHERIILADAGAFELGDEEARALAADLNREFADLGHFHVAHSRRWYLRLKEALPFPAQPLSAVAGRRVAGDDLTTEARTSRLRTWLNEIQMFLHRHPVNESRAAAGHPAVNSLWLWGGGPLPAPQGGNWDGLWSRDPLALGLARAAGIPTHPTPPDLAALLEHAAPDSTQLVLLDQLHGPVLYEDAAGWRTALEKLEKDWFAPLKAGLGRKLAPLTLIAPTVYGQLSWDVAAGERWKFWRKPRPLAELAKDLAEEFPR